MLTSPRSPRHSAGFSIAKHSRPSPDIFAAISAGISSRLIRHRLLRDTPRLFRRSSSLLRWSRESFSTRYVVTCDPARRHLDDCGSRGTPGLTRLFTRTLAFFCPWYVTRYDELCLVYARSQILGGRCRCLFSPCFFPPSGSRCGSQEEQRGKWRG